jgi:Flp pilus assembly protein TadD
MSHVFILSATNYRVPRWFTEGLAVHEEGQANPAWANRLTPEVVVAIRDKKLLPVAQLDRGFLFPEYPDQVIVSYWQAGSICDFIQQQWGADALMGMVHSFADKKTTPEAVEANLHVTPDAFDVRYRTWLDKQVSGTVADFDVWRAQLKALAQGSSAKDSEEAIRSAQAAIKLYPEYVEDANLYEFLANAEERRGNPSGARDALLSYQKEGGESPEALKKLASLQKQLGDAKGAAATLDGLNFIYPEDEGLHRELGTLWLSQGNAPGAVREFGAVIALKPLDMASAEFDLARAYMAEGDRGRAEESVLASLEAAPGFKPAQVLLLELEGDGQKSSTPVTNKPQTN